MTTKKKKPAKRRAKRKHNPSHAAPRAHRAAPRRRRRHNPSHAPKRRRHHARRKNPGSMLGQILMAVGAGVGAKLVTDFGVSKGLASQSDYVKGAVKVVAGIGGAILLRKHPAAAFGVGVGVAGPAVVALIKPMLPASLSSLEDDYAPALEALRRGEARLGMGAIMGAEELAALDNAYS